MTKGVAVGLAPGVWGFMVLNTKGAQRALKKVTPNVLPSRVCSRFCVGARDFKFQAGLRVEGLPVTT